MSRIDVDVDIDIAAKNKDKSTSSTDGWSTIFCADCTNKRRLILCLEWARVIV